MSDNLVRLEQLSHFKALYDNKLLTILDGYAKSTAIPTKVSALTNDSGYQTSTQVNSLINSAISSFTSIKFEIVSSLPSSGQNGTFYLVSNGGTGNNVYDEYIWVSSKFEKVGSTAVDLTSYITKNALTTTLSSYVKTIDIVYATDSDIEALFA